MVVSVSSVMQGSIPNCTSVGPYTGKSEGDILVPFEVPLDDHPAPGHSGGHGGQETIDGVQASACDAARQRPSSPSKSSASSSPPPSPSPSASKISPSACALDPLANSSGHRHSPRS